MNLFFDTETTGLPRSWKAPVTDLNNWPRMVQIAWILSDDNGKRIETKSHIIKPDGFSIPSGAAAVHRITTQRAIEEGEELIEVLTAFESLVKQADLIVAHNISFDEKIVGAEFLRMGIDSEFSSKETLCTMHASTNYCKIPGQYGFKWPKLSELHQTLFGTNFDEAHDASVDISATEKCYWELKKRGVV